MAANLRVRMRDLKMAAMLRLRSFCELFTISETACLLIRCFYIGLVRSGVLNRFSLLHSAVQRPVGKSNKNY